MLQLILNVSQDLGEVPHYTKLLEFINLRAQASETTAPEMSKKYRSDVNPVKKPKPSIVKMKILLQQLWELKLSWDDPVPQHIYDIWCQWRSEF